MSNEHLHDLLLTHAKGPNQRAATWTTGGLRVKNFSGAFSPTVVVLDLSKIEVLI
jgi:hypothetical protein